MDLGPVRRDDDNAGRASGFTIKKSPVLPKLRSSASPVDVKLCGLELAMRHR